MAGGLERSCNCVWDSNDHLCMGYSNEDEKQEFFRKKIDELIEEKRKKFGTQDVIAADQVNEREKRKKFATQDAIAADQVNEREKRKKFATQDAIDADQVNEREKRKKRPIVAKKKSQSVPIESNEVTRRLKEYIVNEKNGTEVKMVIQKTLYQSDLEKSQNRLNMPINQLQTLDFLREDEKRLLDNDKNIEVGLLGPRLKMHEKSMVLKKWPMRSTFNYVLITNWNGFVKENQEDLKKDTRIQVWSFRKEGKLHFAIACLASSIEIEMGNSGKSNLNWFSLMFGCFSFNSDEGKTAKGMGGVVKPPCGPEATMIAAARHFSTSHKALIN
ncbi:hypothetical protein LXL04_011152 [Taraxacum kok-saghyz]